jgi:hypothetical protein
MLSHHDEKHDIVGNMRCEGYSYKGSKLPDKSKGPRSRANK